MLKRQLPGDQLENPSPTDGDRIQNILEDDHVVVIDRGITQLPNCDSNLVRTDRTARIRDVLLIGRQAGVP